MVSWRSCTLVTILVIKVQISHFIYPFLVIQKLFPLIFNLTLYTIELKEFGIFFLRFKVNHRLVPKVIKALKVKSKFWFLLWIFLIFWYSKVKVKTLTWLFGLFLSKVKSSLWLDFEKKNFWSQVNDLTWL